MRAAIGGAVDKGLVPYVVGEGPGNDHEHRRRGDQRDKAEHRHAQGELGTRQQAPGWRRGAYSGHSLTRVLSTARKARSVAAILLPRLGVDEHRLVQPVDADRAFEPVAVVRHVDDVPRESISPWEAEPACSRTSSGRNETSTALPERRVGSCVGRLDRAAADPNSQRRPLACDRAAQTDRLADEILHEPRRRLLVDCRRRTDLFDPPAVHHDNAARQRHRLLLIVRDVEDGGREPRLQQLDLEPHLLAQNRVEVAQRLVEQEEIRLVDERARERDALLLSAAQLRRHASAKSIELHEQNDLGNLVRRSYRDRGDGPSAGSRCSRSTVMCGQMA